MKGARFRRDEFALRDRDRRFRYGDDVAAGARCRYCRRDDRRPNLHPRDELRAHGNRDDSRAAIPAALPLSGIPRSAQPLENFLQPILPRTLEKDDIAVARVFAEPRARIIVDPQRDDRAHRQLLRAAHRAPSLR